MGGSLVELLDATRESQLAYLAVTCRLGRLKDLFERLDVELSIDIEDEVNAGVWRTDE